MCVSCVCGVCVCGVCVCDVCVCFISPAKTELIGWHGMDMYVGHMYC